MKKLQIFAASKQLSIANINYRHCGHGRASKGYDLIDSDKNIHVSLEPCFYTGYRWMCSVKGLSLQHFRNMTEVIKYLNRVNVPFKGQTGFKLSA